MTDWFHEWITKRFPAASTDPASVRVERFALPWIGEVAIWHPIDDLRTAPRVPLRAPCTIESVRVDGELAGYVLRSTAEVATWRDLGDASTDADRFFLVEASTIEPVIEWFNDELDTFEGLGGGTDVETVAHGEVRMVVIVSPDGNARLRRGYSPTGELVAAVIET
jgi:hypothetical protein